MKQITILGATNMIGKRILQKAIEKRFKVKVLARNKEKLQGYAEAIEVVEGHYFEKEKLQIALEGSDSIVSTIEPTMDDSLSMIDVDNYLNTLSFIINLMKANKQARWINISGAEVKMVHEELPLARKLMRVKLMATSKPTVIIKDRELQLLAQSNLDWTSIRSPEIKDDVEGEFFVDANKFIGPSVNLNQLCDFMLSEISNKKWIKKAPVVGTK